MQKAADFVLTQLADNGFGPADFSIWEESPLEYNTYTQSWYVLGFCATQILAELRGDPDLADWYAGGAASIMTALQRSDTFQPPGMWNGGGAYFNRSVSTSDAPRTLVDSSSNVIAAFGVVDSASCVERDRCIRPQLDVRAAHGVVFHSCGTLSERRLHIRPRASDL